MRISNQGRPMQWRTEGILIPCRGPRSRNSRYTNMCSYMFMCTCRQTHLLARGYAKGIDGCGGSMGYFRVCLKMKNQIIYIGYRAMQIRWVSASNFLYMVFQVAESSVEA
jgi:hypothetical protein